MFFCVLTHAFPQDLYWEDPEFLPTQGARFPQAKSGGGEIVLMWQEVISREEGKGSTYLSLKTSKDGNEWEEHNRFAGPYPYFGNETSNFSLVVDSKGTIFVSVLASENTIDFFTSRDGGKTFSKSFTKITLTTTLAPRLFVKPDGGFILFVTQERNDILTLFYSVSADGKSWSDLLPLAPESELTLSFLPYYESFQGRDYVVFQALRTGEGGAYQLYMKISENGGRTWGPLLWLTGFEETIPGRTTRPSLFDNQRPHLAVVGNALGLTWERKFGRDSKQIYFTELNPDGSIKTNAEKVTTGFRTTNFPQILRYKDETYLIWFDNRKGDDHIILARKQGAFWTEKDLSPISGVSTFARPVVNNDKLYVFWENKRGDSSRIVLLKPDTTVLPPEIVPVSFAAGKRSRDDVVKFRWTLPRDSSGIAGFSYVWSRSKDEKPEKKLMVLENNRTAEFQATEDGLWYLHVAAEDYAGNFSETATLAYYRDRTPPQKVVFEKAETDELGYLVSNTFSLAWKPPEDDDVAGYTYEFQYVGESRDALRVQPASFAPLPRAAVTTAPRLQFQNQDNGLWALRVAAVDSVGNVGESSTLYVHLNKYIPVTYITAVDATQDEIGTINLRIIGRGFAADGLVRQVVLDTDGSQPWDYVFELNSGAYSVSSDRMISGPSISEIQRGEYRIGVLHPLRGLAFARENLKLEKGGTLKFGDFSILYKPDLRLVKRAPLFFTGNALVVWSTVLLLALLMLFSIVRVGELVHEGKRLRMEAIALVSGTSTPWAEKQERLKVMKTKGIGLRIKFTLFITVLVITVVLMVSIPLGFYMTRNQEKNLTEGLFQRVAVLMESLTAGGRTYLPGGNSLELGVLPSQISAMSEARFATISGRGTADPASYDYVWASNDKDIAKKIGTENLVPGVSKIKDEISSKESVLAAEINTQAGESVEDIAKELDKLAGEAIKLALRTDEESRNKLQDLQNTIRTLDTRLNAQLAILGSRIESEPAFSTEKLDFTNTSYTFYKPILYRTRGESTYFRGMVRLGVSTDAIIQEVQASRSNLIIITGIVALIAIVVGVIGALILAFITIMPIKRLVAGVEKIRDTEDKEALKDHVIDVKTHDEIFLLATTINQMTQGLVKAAAANKDLTVGKEIQKMFIPLELGKSGRKLTTGKVETSEAEAFGYYEGAKGVSGDYFDLRKLDDDTYAFIKCDVAGKGVPAALIMVQVATIFTTYFRDYSAKKKINIVSLLYQINDVVENQGFKGRFAAMTLGVLNTRTGIAHISHAGDRILNIYDAGTNTMKQRMMNDCPATGVFPNFMLEMKTPYEQISIPLKSGDIMMLFTDGVDEAHRKLRNPDYSVLQLPPEKEGGEPIEDEMMGTDRINEIIAAAMTGKTYRLEKHHSPIPNEELIFDFSSCEKTAENAVMAMVSVEKIFRMYPNPKAGAQNRIMIDQKVDAFLQKTFKQYGNYFHHPIENPNTTDYANYNFYTHIMEDDQYDDLTLLALRRK